MSENEEIDVRSVRTPEELGLITKEVEAEVLAEEVNTDSIEQLGEELLELTEEEKRQKFIEAVKASHLRYKPKKHFGSAYKAERKRKNKAQRKSRKLNRK